MSSVADPQQIEDSILFPEIIKPSRGKEEAQADKSFQPTFMCKELLEAAINGRKNTLTQLLGLDVRESPDSAHVTIEAPDNSLNQAENLQSRTRTGNTVLHMLASNGHSELAVKTYIKDKSLLEVCNNTEETALHCAARYGHSSVISELIDKAHELDHDLKDTLRKKNRHGETALHEAARHGHTTTVQALITEDPELADQVNKNDESPLYLATVEGHVAMFQLFVQHLCHREITSAYYSGPKGTTALHAAALRSNKQGLEMANELLKLEPGTLTKIADIFGSTPLHYATSTGDARMARKLLNHDASLAYCDDSRGLFPIHVAAYMGHWETVITILENNFDSWELLDQRGRNFLHLVAEGKSTIIYYPLFYSYARGINLEEVLRKAIFVRDNEGNTPLHIAARCGKGWAVRDFFFVFKGWFRSALTSLDNLALSNSKVVTTESYEEIYQHYETLQELGKAERSPQRWLLSYTINKLYPVESSDTLAWKVQTIALGSVLIATVTFAAAFTPPGGFNSGDGTPVLGRKYVFRAFILADVVAFASSFYCTFYLIILGANKSGRYLQEQLYWTQYLFMIASISMGLAFALGLYVALAPLSKGFSIFVLVVALLAAIRRFMFRRNIPLWVLGWAAPFITVFLLAFIK
ncbi:hypothetical protein LUZ63_001025 [Rhynchospora breviuscula]|uniref:PGG domain-containing protein n=1 Tax=Rhynchospora breviuscula TaxID=2022672 RepID=A0A9Q0HWN8_9POAL|nr:hypothetical protein LUZ63_001025 [Rhynchospora breviuscula]